MIERIHGVTTFLKLTRRWQIVICVLALLLMDVQQIDRTDTFDTGEELIPGVRELGDRG